MTTAEQKQIVQMEILAVLIDLKEAGIIDCNWEEYKFFLTDQGIDWLIDKWLFEI